MRQRLLNLEHSRAHSLRKRKLASLGNVMQTPVRKPGTVRISLVPRAKKAEPLLGPRQEA